MADKPRKGRGRKPEKAGGKGLDKRLHPHETRILLALKSMGSGKAGEIAGKTGLSESSVHKAGQWARLKGLVDTEESGEKKSELTQEGMKYARKGLPEKRLLVMIKGGKTSIDELREHPEFEIALAWARRKGWIRISGRSVSLTPLGRNVLKTTTDAERALRDPGSGPHPELQKRKLLKVKETRGKTFSLTEKGRESLPGLKEDRSIGQLTPAHIKSGAWKEADFRPYDTGLPAPVLSPARLHPYTQFINEVRSKLVAMGFQEMAGPWVELEFWNMDALFMPQDHPARGIHDVFRIKDPQKGEVRDKRALGRVAKTHRDGWITGSSGWGSWDPEQTLGLVLRSQTTAVSARTLASGVEDPSMHFTLSRVFRPDVVDATHSLEFDQLEGIVVGEKLSLRHLMGYLETFGKEVAGAEKIRFRPGYFPFTEPSLEMDAYVNGKWVELVGSGIFRPEVTRPLGVDRPVLAWGMGFNRLAMIKLGISDIRELFSHDLEWLRKRDMVYR